MDIVRKFKAGETTYKLKAITEQEANALFWVFVKNNGSDSQRHIAQSIAQYLKDHDGWLRCHCRAGDLPLITAGISINNHYYLRHLNARAEHDKHCRFKAIDRPNLQYEHHAKPCSKNVPLRLHRLGVVSQEGKSKEKKEAHNHCGNRYPRLARVLYSFIDDARLNQFTIEDKLRLADRYHLLQKAVAPYQLERGIKASDYLFTYPDVGRMAEKLEESKHCWPEHSRAYAICISIADQVVNNTLHFNFKDSPVEVTLSGKLIPSSGRVGNSSPFLVIFTVTDTTDEPGVYKPFNGFYVPAYSKSRLIPVDSSYEREVLKLIAHRAHWWQQKHGLKFKIIKPLFDIKTLCEGQLQTARPDFLIETPNRNIIFEVMGSHEDEYLERKRRTLKIMQEIGEVIEFDAFYADRSGHWDKTLKDSVSKLTTAVFNGNE